ncbi:ABC transporter substrate-binding protein [Jiangella asiatica]|uniref:Extracellular solute-binding protein n=1 Tax=Jiangella asiatica TaxID=2530372 RepID=A0A4R5DRQ7_9ACTN|nr:extracellular solute-binding protein [Jiangella asiatica]TDE14920.1 extracellular solute-binding protein [Jiangella asiatica]
MKATPRSRGELSRRRLLGMGFGLAGLAAAGCQVKVDDDAAPRPAATVSIPDPQLELPDGDLTFRWVDSGSLKALFNEAVLEAYHEKHPNVTTDYTGQGWPTVNDTVTLGIRNGTAPDIFAMPQSVPPATAVEEGWVQPIDDLIPDFDAWREQWPADALVPGEHIFDGKVYTLPLGSSLVLSQLLIYDVAVLESAGVDPERDLGSWDQMRAAARTVTQQGGGDVFGLIIPGGQRIGRIVMELAVSAGWRSSETIWGFDFSTGEYAFDAPEIMAALEHLRAFEADGSLFPGSLTFKNDDVVGRMPNGVAGMTFHGNYYVAEWKQGSPGWEFGFAGQPPQEEGGAVFEPYQALGNNNVWVYADTPYPTIAADLLSYVGSVEGQTQLVRMTSGLLQSVIPEANEAAQGFDLDPHGVKSAELAREQMRKCPIPSARNPEVSAALVEAQTIKPDFNELVQGVFTGDITDAAKAFAEYNATLNRSLDESIAEARAKGADISRDDWVFTDWDPTQDYTA